MPVTPLQLLFDSRILLAEGVAGVLLIMLFTLLMLPSVLKSGTRTEVVAKATYGYIAQTIGLFLMTVAGLPAFYAAFGWASYSSGAYAGLLTIFAVGGILFLWQDGIIRTLDPASRLLPQIIFTHVWKLIGLLAVLTAGLSGAFFLFTNTAPLTPGWWVMYAGLFLYGVIVSWLTFERPGMRPPVPFNIAPMRPMKMTTAAKVKKPIARKPVKRAKK
jgi:hypothetical protein